MGFYIEQFLISPSHLFKWCWKGAWKGLKKDWHRQSFCSPYPVAGIVGRLKRDCIRLAVLLQSLSWTAGMASRLKRDCIRLAVPIQSLPVIHRKQHCISRGTAWVLCKFLFQTINCLGWFNLKQGLKLIWLLAIKLELIHEIIIHKIQTSSNIRKKIYQVSEIYFRCVLSCTSQQSLCYLIFCLYTT